MTREQNIKAIASAIRHRQFGTDEIDLDDFLTEAVDDYDALFASLSPLQRAILEGDERYVVVDKSVLDEFIEYANSQKGFVDNEFICSTKEQENSDAEFASFIDRLLPQEQSNETN